MGGPQPFLFLLLLTLPRDKSTSPPLEYTDDDDDEAIEGDGVEEGIDDESFLLFPTIAAFCWLLTIIGIPPPLLLLLFSSVSPRLLLTSCILLLLTLLVIRGAAAATDDEEEEEGRGDPVDRSISKAIAALCCWDFLRASRLASNASFS
jgi:hypothetical protein